jgi:hypothetical protein
MAATSTPEQNEKKLEFLSNIATVLEKDDEKGLELTCEALMTLVDSECVPEFSFAHKPKSGRYSVCLSNCRRSLDGLGLATAVRICDEHVVRLDLRPGHGDSANLIQATMVMLSSKRRNKLRLSDPEDSDSASDSHSDDGNQSKEEPNDEAQSEPTEEPFAYNSLLDTMNLSPSDMFLLKTLLTAITKSMGGKNGQLFGTATERYDAAGYRVFIGPFFAIDWHTLVLAVVGSGATYRFSIEVGLGDGSTGNPKTVTSVCKDARMWVAIEVPRSTKRKRTTSVEEHDTRDNKRVRRNSNEDIQV